MIDGEAVLFTEPGLPGARGMASSPPRGSSIRTLSSDQEESLAKSKVDLGQMAHMDCTP